MIWILMYQCLNNHSPKAETVDDAIPNMSEYAGYSPVHFYHTKKGCLAEAKVELKHSKLLNTECEYACMEAVEK